MKRMFILCFFVGLFIFSMKTKIEAQKIPIARFSKIAPLEFKGENELERMKQFQIYWKKVSLEAMSLFKDIPKVAELIEFMKENAIFSIPIGPKATKFVMTYEEWELAKNNPKKFEIVFMPEEYADSMPSSIYTEKGGRVVRVAANFRVKEWLGIMLIHELFHVYSQIIEGEDPDDPGQYLMGEVKAHLLEIEMLKLWSIEAFNLLIENGIPLYKSGDKKGMFYLFESLYPISEDIVSEKERYLGAGSCLVAIAFEEALRRGATEKELVEVYKSLLK